MCHESLLRRCPTANPRVTTRGGKTHQNESLKLLGTTHSSFLDTLPPAKSFLHLKSVVAPSVIITSPQKPPLMSQAGAEPSRTPTRLNPVPCTISVLLMMEWGGSSFRSSAACELNGRPGWKLKARFRLGKLDWAGVLQRHRAGFPRETNMHKGELKSLQEQMS